MQAFRVQGFFPMGVNRKQPFTVELTAADEDAAREKALSTLGSKHHIKRQMITIDLVMGIDNDDVTDPIVQVELGE